MEKSVLFSTFQLSIPNNELGKYFNTSSYYGKSILSRLTEFCGLTDLRKR